MRNSILGAACGLALLVMTPSMTAAQNAEACDSSCEAVMEAAARWAIDNLGTAQAVDSDRWYFSLPRYPEDSPPDPVRESAAAVLAELLNMEPVQRDEHDGWRGCAATDVEVRDCEAHAGTGFLGVSVPELQEDGTYVVRASVSAITRNLFSLTNQSAQLVVAKDAEQGWVVKEVLFRVEG